MERHGTDPPGRYEGDIGYSRVVRSGPHVWVAGCTAVNDDGIVMGTTPGEQMTYALENVEKALEQVGASLSDVVRTRMYVTDIYRWEEIGRAHGTAFADIRPVTSMVEVRGFIDPRMLVEIEADAFVEGDLAP
jgi:enamine deaminase RidA (YjgF/YER057c/UK114 family)